MAKQKLSFDEALQAINDQTGIRADDVQARARRYWASRDVQTVGA